MNNDQPNARLSAPCPNHAAAAGHRVPMTLAARRAGVPVTGLWVAAAGLWPAAAHAADGNYGAWSLLPPVLAIVLALVIRQVIPALFLGLWAGAWILAGSGPAAPLAGLFASFQVYVLKALANPDHAAVILFSMMIGGMVGILGRNGGMAGIVRAISGLITDARGAATATAAMGLAIFFDDYANTLVVGNTMRPLTDRLRVSRAKLAYIVDSTAAPVACIALVTTWVGYEVGLIQDAIAPLAGLDTSPYLIYISSIAYSFYPLLAIVMVFIIALSGRDFGPMYTAERQAAQGNPGSAGAQCAGDDLYDSDKMSSAWNAVLPILLLLATVVAGLWYSGSAALDGREASWRNIIGAADAYQALLWSSLAGVVGAVTLSFANRLLALSQIVDAWFAGVRTMLMAMIILVLAWALSDTTQELGTADYLVGILPAALGPQWMPAIVFVLAALTSFATGSSWGTMGILLPLVVPLVWSLLGRHEMAADSHLYLLHASVAAALTGAVWGDHCSPISDTTILSSMASGCDHIEHVRTQLPYALTAGVASVLFGALPAGFGMPWYLALALSLGALLLVVHFLGRKPGPAAGG